MRVEASLSESSVTQALVKGGCPVCLLLKQFQSELIDSADSQAASLCNFHAWALAKGAPGHRAATVYMNALHTAGKKKTPTKPICDFCRSIREEEEARLNELVRQMRRPMFLNWMERHGTLCLRHAGKISSRIPVRLQAKIAAIVGRTAGELEEEIVRYIAEAEPGSRAGGGVLGRAAEFLVGQRGLAE
jgi:hypothetical protein